MRITQIKLILLLGLLLASVACLFNGSLSGNLQTNTGVAGTQLMLVQINETADIEDLSFTFRKNLVVNTIGEFTFQNIPPGKYCIFNFPSIVSLDYDKDGKVTVGTAEWPISKRIEYATIIKSKSSNSLICKEAVMFDDKVVIFAINPGQTLRIDKPILLE